MSRQGPKVTYRACISVRVEDGWLLFTGIEEGSGLLSEHHVNLANVFDWTSYDDPDVEDAEIVEVFYSGGGGEPN